ncbi:MAG TPA: VOC family protein [Streptosporangiaceae bacterium]|nr:VOC family protein [Streptosporangiaceae bacterium]
MKVMPIRYVANMAAATRFYAALGLVEGDSSRSGNWMELNGSGGTLALHTARTAEQDVPGRVELSFETQEPLEALAERLTAAGFEPEAIVDESFGRSLHVMDPDGVLVQVNEHDRDLYT